MNEPERFEAFCAAVADTLRGELPGPAAQQLMSTVPRRPVDDRVLRRGGVLLLLYGGADGVCLPLTRRDPHLAHHGGQISLPGGGWEPSDASLADTAVREAREELGIDPACVHVLGALSPLNVPISANQIFPFVACHSGRPEFRPEPTEVAEVIETPLRLLLRPDVRAEQTRLRDDEPVRTPYYRVGPHQVWGATAMILSEFLTLIGPLAVLLS
jgi:8-oxo-dGTP pyrophosphatase MutT (NUDIX family)